MMIGNLPLMIFCGNPSLVKDCPKGVFLTDSEVDVFSFAIQ